MVMLSFAFEEDPASVSLYPVLKIKEATELSYAGIFWILLGLVYHSHHALLALSDGYREAISHVRKTECCPKRRSRYLKCARRCTRRKDEALSEANSNYQCSFEKFYRMHYPPPLPFRKHKKKGKTTQEDSPQHEVSKVPPVNNPAPPTGQANSKVVQVTPSRDAQGGYLKRAHISSAPTRPASAALPRTPLIDLARMQQWSVILQQITRREAKYCDLDGLYPLHWTVSGGPPTDVVQALLDHYPSAAHKADSEGSLPLHFACHYSASVGVIEALLQVYPKAIRAKDKYGRTPLYHAVDKAASMEVHEMLVKADPTMVTVPCLPASLLQDYERQQPVGANTSRGVAIRTPLFLAWVAVRSDSRTRRERKQGKKWDKAILLLRVAYHQGFIKDDSPKVPFNTTLHAAISLDVYLPEQVILMVTEAYPGQLERVETVNGQLPLALAADLSHYSNCRSDFLIELLLQAFPRAVESRDRRGRFPLSLALASGKRLDTGVQRLLQAAPDTIFWRDGLTGLVPALEAASATTQDDQVVSSYPVEIAKDPFCLLNTKQRESIAHWRRRSLGLLSTPPTIKSKNEKDTISNSPETCNVATIYELISAHPSVLIRNPAS